MVQTTMTMK
jgi:hypothetical protein